MATADYLSSADLKGIAFNGLIREDVMNQLWDISNIPLPLTDRISSDTTSNSYAEWVTSKLASPNINNAVVDGADVSAYTMNTGQKRVGNQCQISVKAVAVTQRAQRSDVIGASNELAYQIMENQKELRRDVEAIMLTQQASVADDGDTVAGKSAGLGAWITGTNASRGATGADGGFANGVVAAPTPGTPRAISETMIRDVCQAVYEKGGNPSLLMTTPALVRKISEYMFTSSARIATATSDVGQSREAAVAKGAVNVFVTDFGIVLEITPNRLQPVVATGNVNCYLIDPQYIRQSFLEGYNVQPLAKNGLADRREMSVDWTLKVLSPDAQGVIADIDPALAMVA